MNQHAHPSPARAAMFHCSSFFRGEALFSHPKIEKTIKNTQYPKNMKNEKTPTYRKEKISCRCSWTPQAHRLRAPRLTHGEARTFECKQHLRRIRCLYALDAHTRSSKEKMHSVAHLHIKTQLGYGLHLRPFVHLRPLHVLKPRCTAAGL